MNQTTNVRALFAVAGLYDGLLGLGFLFAGPQLFSRMGVPAPNHWGYVHFPALLLIVFAVAFFAIARDPLANRNLIPFGVLLKISYCAIVFYYWLLGGVPSIWKPFAFIDLLFLVLFLWAYRAMRPLNAPDSNPPFSVARP